MNTVALHTIDEEIRLLVGRNDHKGMQLLYEHYAPMIYGALLKAIADVATAEKLLQKTLLRVSSSISEFDPGKQSLLTWLMHITRELTKEHRSLPATGSTQKDHADLNDLVNRYADPTSDDVCREMLEWVYFKGYTAQQLSEITKLPETLIRQNIRKALKIVNKSG